MFLQLILKRKRVQRTEGGRNLTMNTSLCISYVKQLAMVEKFYVFIVDTEAEESVKNGRRKKSDDEHFKGASVFRMLNSWLW